jgi:hypothetical protein
MLIMVGVKETDTGLAPPSMWDLAADKQMMQEDQPLQVCSLFRIVLALFLRPTMLWRGGDAQTRNCAVANLPPPLHLAMINNDFMYFLHPYDDLT